MPKALGTGTYGTLGMDLGEVRALIRARYGPLRNLHQLLYQEAVDKPLCCTVPCDGLLPIYALELANLIDR